jgi:hypothetical protein
MAVALFSILCVCAVNSGSALGQNVCESEEVKELVKRNTYLSSGKIPLLVTPLPKVKEDFLGIMLDQAESESRKIKPINFYEVMPAIYEIQNGVVVSEAVELDNENAAWIVAVGSNKSLYLLAGFPNPLSGFNQLTKDLGIKANSPDAALDIFDLFLKTARGQRFRSVVVADKMKLQSVALEDFRLRYPAVRRQEVFDRWWKGIPLNFKERLTFPKVQSEDDGFKITYYRYDRGRIREESLFIDTQGAVQEGASKVLYPEEPPLRREARRDNR